MRAEPAEAPLRQALPSVSAVVPVYRGARTIEELATRLDAVLSTVCDDFELVMVNDGSPDDSWAVIERLCTGNPRIRGINLMRNYGQHNATLCGVRAARFELLVTLDDDLQHPPEEIPALLDRLAEGWDLVYGVPQRRTQSWWRSGFSALMKWSLSRTMGTATLRDIGAFRAFRSSLRRAFEDYHNPNAVLDVLLSWGTTRYTSVTVRQDPRADGRSTYSFGRLLALAATVTVAYSTRPLRFASFLGLAFTVFGLGVLVYALYVYFVIGGVEGFTFVVSIIAIFSGAQLFSLGIIGEYVARVFDRSIDRPAYVVATEVGR